MTVVLHDYWRSGAAYRVRIALNLKGVAYDQIPVDLRAGAHRNAAYLAVNPQGLVPAVEVEGEVLTQSLAVLEWIEERWPDPALLPSDLIGRAQVRAMTAMVACDIHPLHNLRTLQSIRNDLGADEAQVAAWTQRWIGAGFQALETLIGRHGAGWAWGDAPTLADCALLPQIYSARRFEVDLAPYPAIRAIEARAAEHPAFAAAHPNRQADAPKD
jgi:maleylpyruvate isomerase